MNNNSRRNCNEKWFCMWWVWCWWLTWICILTTCLSLSKANMNLFIQLTKRKSDGERVLAVKEVFKGSRHTWTGNGWVSVPFKSQKLIRTEVEGELNLQWSAETCPSFKTQVVFVSNSILLKCAANESFRLCKIFDKR